jgi:acetyl/propionyl-CoA carboxylase alpha subunit
MSYDFRVPSNDRRSAAAVPTDYAEAKQRSDELEAEYLRTGRALKALSGGGPMGMTPAEVRATSEWKAAKREADAALAAFRNFNEVYVHRFKREIQQDRRDRGR